MDLGGPHSPPKLSAVDFCKGLVARLYSEAAADAADLALKAGGGAAFRKESVVERLFRDSRAARVMAPTTDALQDFIGRAVNNTASTTMPGPKPRATQGRAAFCRRSSGGLRPATMR